MSSSERRPLAFATLWVAAIASLLLGGTAQVQAQQHVLKIASLAPEGSSWISTLRAIDTEVRERTAGAVRFKIYPGPNGTRCARGIGCGAKRNGTAGSGSPHKRDRRRGSWVTGHGSLVIRVSTFTDDC